MQTPLSFLRLRRLAAANPCALLLAAQLASLALYPLMDESHDGRVLFGAVALFVVPLTVWVVQRSPSAIWIAWLLGAPALLLSASAIAFGQPALIAWSAVLESALYFYAAGSLIRYMLADNRVSSDELFAAAATFTLLAWGFAYAFYACQAWVPGSFTGLQQPQRARSWIELLFLSVSTLSGVGSGDVIPLRPQARSLVMLAQFAGVGYIAAVVSRLIGMTLRRERDRRGGG